MSKDGLCRNVAKFGFLAEDDERRVSDPDTIFNTLLRLRGRETGLEQLSMACCVLRSLRVNFMSANVPIIALSWLRVIVILTSDIFLLCTVFTVL